MEIKMLQEDELRNTSGLSRYVFDNCLRNRMEFPQTISFVEDYLTIEHLTQLQKENRLILWGAFEQEQLVGVAGLQSDGMITMLYVLPQFWNRSIGSQLLHTMRVYAKEIYGFDKVVLNATPSWTALYFKKKGFQFLDANQNMRAPYVGMYALSNTGIEVIKRRIPKRYILLAVSGCIVLATIATAIFMSWYLG